jgi:hypothetical protein
MLTGVHHENQMKINNEGAIDLAMGVAGVVWLCVTMMEDFKLRPAEGMMII